METYDETYDAVIVGGGPAGSTLAALLAVRGRRALVLEQDRHPRFHIGESLLPMSCEVLDRLGLRERMDGAFLRKYGAKFFCCDSGRQNEYVFSESYDKRFDHAYQVPRAEFDQLLFRRARELGAEVREGWRVREVQFEGGRAVGVTAIPVAGLGGDGAACLAQAVSIRARFVVDATGRSSLIASALGEKQRLPALDQQAMFAHYRGVPRESGLAEGHIWVVVFRGGWFWVIPFKGGVTSVGAVVSRAFASQRNGQSLEAFMDRTIGDAPVMRDALKNAERLTAVRTTADFSYGVRSIAGDGWLCVGDACGFIDPLFSTGAHLAIKGGQLAADAIDAALAEKDGGREALSRYQHAVRDAGTLFLGVVQAFYRGAFRELLFEQPQRRAIRQIVTSLLSGDVFHEGRVPPWVPFIKARYPAELPS